MMARFAMVVGVAGMFAAGANALSVTNPSLGAIVPGSR